MMNRWASILAAIFSTATSSDREEVSDPRIRTLRSDALHVFVMTSFAIAQPVFDRLGNRLSFLTDQNIPNMAVWILVLTLSIGLPVTVILLELLAESISRRSRDVVHSAVVFIVSALMTLCLLVRFDVVPGVVFLGIALTTASVGTWWYFESARVRAMVTLASPGVILFPVLFLSQFFAAQVETGPSASRSSRWRPFPVVFVVFDEFCGSSIMTTERELDAERFPNFAALAKRATWYRNATSVNPNTEHAVPAILSGRLPTQSHLPSPIDRPQNLFSVLHLAGDYKVAAFEPVTNLVPRDLIAVDKADESRDLWTQTASLFEVISTVYLFQIVPAEYRPHLPLIPRTWFGMRDASQVDRKLHRGVFNYGWNDQRDEQFQHFLECIDDASDSTLFFGHFLLPHVPWCYLPSGRHYMTDSNRWELCVDNGNETANESIATQNQQRYLLQIMYVDHLIGKLLSRLEETGLLDRCLLVVTADHGTSFHVGQPRRQLSSGNEADILSVPLFIKLPHQTEGQISDRLVESVDIFPTVADVLGMTLDGQNDGRSLIDMTTPERLFVRSSDFHGVRNFDPKLIRASATPAEIERRFGSPSDRHSLFRIGPIPELIRCSIETLPQTTSPPLELRLTRFGDTVDEDTTSNIPCFFEGAVISPFKARTPVNLAVAINGTIHAVTQTIQDEEIGNHWSAMVPEWAFHVGKNDVRFFAVTGNDWQLTPCVIVETKPTIGDSDNEKAQQ